MKERKDMKSKAIKWSDIKRLAALAGVTVRQITNIEGDYYDFFQIEFEWLSQPCNISVQLHRHDCLDGEYKKGDFAAFYFTQGPTGQHQRREYDTDVASRLAVGAFGYLIADGVY